MRVRVDARTWLEFRNGVETGTLAQRLGELVAREAAKERRRRLDADELHLRELIDALERVGALSEELASITRRLELLRGARSTARLARRPLRTAAPRPILAEGGERPPRPGEDRWSTRDVPAENDDANDPMKDLFSYPDHADPGADT